MRSIALPARRAFIAAIAVFFLLYTGYVYEAAAVALLFVISWFFFPAKQPRDFCAGVIPVIDALTEYLRSLSTDSALPISEGEIFNSFLVVSSKYPEWAYQRGFNRGLRSGFRHFLIQLEHAADLCCSIGYWYVSSDVLKQNDELMTAWRQSLKINIVLLAGLSRMMHHHAEKSLRPVNDVTVDFVSDIVVLEEVLQRLVPSSIELLDMSQTYLQMTALVRDMKDLREVLLLLTNAVPVSS